MLGLVQRVVAAEGLASAGRRGLERLVEAAGMQRALWRGRHQADRHAPLLNVCGMPAVARLGGLPIQLRARLHQEIGQRRVALWHPGWLELGRCAWRMPDLETAVEMTGARWLHLEGSFGLDLERVLRLPVQLLLSLHDLHLLTRPAGLREALFERAQAVIFPSDWLRSAYALDGIVIAPGTAAARPPAVTGSRQHIAIVGSLKPHKGGALLPELIRAVPAHWHVMGGGDAELLQALRGLKGVRVHGYYRCHQLPGLLARHHIGLAVLPSTGPESYGLTLSECWLAGVPALAFAHGALGARIQGQGGGWLAPPESGAAGLAGLVQRWLRGELQTQVPDRIDTPEAAAQAHLALYRCLNIGV